MSDLFTPEEIEKTRLLLELFSTNGLSELTVVDPDGYRIEIGTTPEESTTISYQSASVAVVPPAPTHHAPAPKQKSAKKTYEKSLNSPMVGIFYTSPAPGDPPFVNVGDTVKVGQTIGLIEAMKVFSEIPAESAGRILEVVAQTGTLVQQAQPLFSIEPV